MFNKIRNLFTALFGVCTITLILIPGADPAFADSDPYCEANPNEHDCIMKRDEMKRRQSSPAEAAPKPAPEPEGPPPKILTEETPKIAGPKRTVAVGKFDAVGSFTQKYGNWDVGGGLAAMLTSALLQSEQFIVLERAQIREILSEHELKAGGLVSPSTGPKLGNLAGVQLMIYGAVTEFGAEEKGGGLNFGFSGGSLPFTLGGASQQASGSVAMDIRVVDTTTGQVIESYTIREPIETSAFNLSVGYQGISLGGDQFMKTPLGAASRTAIKKAVYKIISTANNRPWQGRVVLFEGGDVFINAGNRTGIKKGDLFMIETITKTLTDPSTGEILGTRKNELGVVTIRDVQEKMAIGSYKGFDRTVPKRGDLVIMMQK